jgi:carbonic anhydrase
VCSDCNFSVRKILHFDSPRDRYHCDASVVGCFDNRFDAVKRKLLKRIGVTHPDLIKIAGGAKALASPDEEFHRTFVLDQIHKSIRLHGTDRVILMLHSDCGAYGGLAGRFQDDTDAETAHYHSELSVATAFLKSAIPGIKVESFIFNFEGAWLVEESTVATAGAGDPGTGHP